MTSSVIRRLVPAAAAALVLLSGCSGSDDSKPEAKASGTPTAGATPSAPPIDPSQIACRMLTPSDRSSLAGTAVDEVVAASGTDGGSQCRWQADAAVIQVTTLPAKEWAKSLPDVVTKLEASSADASASDKKDIATAKKLLSGAASFTDAQACQAFTTLAELDGEPKGATTTVTSIPITDTESGISAQGCADGELTSVLYSIPGLKETEAIDTTVTTILERAQKRYETAQ